MRHFILYLLFAFAFFPSTAQPGKDGALTVASQNQILNHYIPVSTDIAIGSNTVAMANGSLFSLCPGDLIMIYQAQGANTNTTNTSIYGTITAYNSAGLYEFKYIQSVNGNLITTQTTFTNSYVAVGKIQVVKVPQYTTLTVNASASIIPKLWKDTIIASTPYRFGGLVVIHTTNIINNGTISATGSGFRGGQLNNNSIFINGLTNYVSSTITDGGEKGEGISGYQIDYDNIGGRYCRGANANGGGGGTSTNAAGGGGANGYNGNPWSGQGVMIVNTNNPLAAWSIDPGYIANGNALTNSSGGGRGGYAWADYNGNALVDTPGSPVWGGDNRREIGGMGGHSLTNINSETRIYFGGGGGAGHQNNNGATPGSSGGGIVFLIAINNFNGNGVIESDGNNVGNNSGCSCDGSGGGGAGGSIIIKTNSIASSQIITTNGGNGGNQLSLSSPAAFYESEGPGGGGCGGFVAISTGAILPSVGGGLNGTTISTGVTEFPFNGATQGALGQVGSVSNLFITYTAAVTPTIGTSIITCLGSALNLTTTPGASSYFWSGPNSFTSSLQNTSIANVSTNASGIYTVTQNFLGCQPPAAYMVTVTVDPIPTPLITNNTSSNICSGQTISLSGNGGSSYQWSGPSAFTSSLQNILITPATSINNGTYTLTAFSVNGCSATIVSPIITVNSTPTVSVNGTSVCINQPVSLNVNSSATSFLWNGPNSFTSSAPTVNFSNANFTLSGNYNVLVTSAQGCTNTAVANVSVYPLPTPSLSSNSPVCAGSTLNLTGGGGVSYSYNGPNGFSSNLQNPSITNVSNAANGIYTLTVSNFGCSASVTLSVSIYGAGSGTLSTNNNAACIPFCPSFSVTSNSSSVISASISINGQLFLGNKANYCITIPGTYTVNSVIKDNDGCVNTASLLVTAYGPPNADFIFSPAKPIENMDNVLFTNTSSGPGQTTWNWFFMDNNGYTSFNQNTFFLFETAGNYPVAMIVKNQWGCSDTVVKIVNVGEDFSFYVPNTFTPNEDGLNDIFLPKGHGIKDYKMEIFDRWGEKLFISTDFYKGWDGTFKGKKCEIDTYIWKIELQDQQSKSRSFTGHVNIIE